MSKHRTDLAKLRAAAPKTEPDDARDKVVHDAVTDFCERMGLDPPPPRGSAAWRERMERDREQVDEAVAAFRRKIQEERN